MDWKRAPGLLIIGKEHTKDLVQLALVAANELCDTHGKASQSRLATSIALWRLAGRSAMLWACRCFIACIGRRSAMWPAAAKPASIISLTFTLGFRSSESPRMCASAPRMCAAGHLYLYL